MADSTDAEATDVKTDEANDGRLIAVGDVHGCSAALEAILRAIDPQPSDTIVALGDYIDRGPHSRDVLEQLLDLESRCRLVTLLGNHEWLMLAARGLPGYYEMWMKYGGREALASYGPKATLDHVPEEHWRFLERCRLFYATKTHLFVHASYDPSRTLETTSRTTLLWEFIGDPPPSPHFSGRVAVVGHTPQPGGKVLQLPHLICLDTGCVKGGVLSAMDVASGTLWQADAGGIRRE